MLSPLATKQGLFAKENPKVLRKVIQITYFTAIYLALIQQRSQGNVFKTLEKVLRFL